MDGTESILSRFKETFVTGNNVLTEIFSKEDITKMGPAERAREDRRLSALRSFWDGCVQTALFRRTEHEEGLEFDNDSVAFDLGVKPSKLVACSESLSNLLRDWLSEPVPNIRDEVLAKAMQITFDLCEPKAMLSGPEKLELFRFLVEVTALVFQFLRLVPAQQAMVAEGVHREPLFQDGISEDLARSVPDALLGRLSGIRFHVEDVRGRATVRIQYVTFRGAPRVLLYRMHELHRHEGQSSGPAVLMASATSYLEESPSYHVPVGPHIVLRRRISDASWRDSIYKFDPIPDSQSKDGKLRFSGSPVEKRKRILCAMIDHYFEGESPLVQRLVNDFDPGRRVGFVVNSYEQVRWCKEHLSRKYPVLAEKIIGVIDRPPIENSGDWITTAQVEKLNARDDWIAIVFPMRSLARGVNIVFEQGQRRRDALIGSLVFLTRPHPASESLDLVAGIAGSQTLAFDQRKFEGNWGVPEFHREWVLARAKLMAIVRRLLRFPIMASKLGDLAEPFTADVMVDVLQTIGRAMRNGCKARVIFADAAWAPNSAVGGADDADSSMLVRMCAILEKRVSSIDPIEREIYQALYEPFLEPLRRCHGLNFAGGEKK